MTTQRQPENQQYIIDALDQAISAAFNENFRKIAQGKTENEIRAIFAQRITQTIPNPQPPTPGNDQPPESNNAPPESNDEAAALIYVVTYQLQHINLTYSLINTLLNRQPALTKTGQLHIINLNPKALAMQFGVTIAIADALQNGQNITSVTIDHLTVNPPFRQLGETIWQEFANIIQSEISRQNRQFQWLYRACNLIHQTPRHDLTQIQKPPHSDTWLNLIYAAHETPANPIPPNLPQLLAKIKPQAAFLTCCGNYHGATASAPTPEKISPFAPHEYQTSLLYGNPQQYVNPQQYGSPQQPRQPAIPNRLGRHFAEKVTNLNKLFRLVNNRQISPRTEAAILNWPWDTASLICIAKPAPTSPPAPKPPLPPQTAQPQPQPQPPNPTPPAAAPPTPAPYAIGDRVQTPIGSGQIWRINKTRADVRLDNGLSTTIPIADLTPAPP